MLTILLRMHRIYFIIVKRDKPIKESISESVFQINDMEYFAPLSSFKPKHEKMKEGLDFIKILRYAVINLNNMFPVPYSERVYVNFETNQRSQLQIITSC